MKTENMTYESILDLMGSEATKPEALALAMIIDDLGVCDTDELPDKTWFSMIADAVETVENETRKEKHGGN